MSDMVNHPDHYISESGIETIDVIEAFTKDIQDPFEAYCTGNIIKYICRWSNKNGIEDLKKARWYLNKLIGHHKKDEDVTFLNNLKNHKYKYVGAFEEDNGIQFVYEKQDDDSQNLQTP